MATTTGKRPRLIGIYSPRPQSGKTVVAHHLTTHGYRRESFAAPLKSMLHSLFVSAGYRGDVINRMLSGDLKEDRCFLDHTSPRYLMQTLGTEWGRICVDPDLWVQVLKRKVLSYTHPVVVDDVRFLNEYQMIKDLGGIMIRITRSSSYTQSTHISEGGLDGVHFDRHVVNDGSISDLLLSIDDSIFNAKEQP